MDPQATATLIGVAIGALATIIAGAVTPWLIARGRSATELRREQRLALANVFAALSALLRGRMRPDADRLQLHADAVVSVNTLMLLAPARDVDLAAMFGFAIDRINDAQVMPQATVGLDAATTIGMKWYRRELKGSRIGDAYEAELTRLLAAHTAR